MNRVISAVLRFVLLIAMPMSAVAQPGALGETRGKSVIAIKAALVIDGTGAAPITNGVVIVTGDKITAVGPAASVRIPEGAVGGKVSPTWTVKFDCYATTAEPAAK